MSLAVLTILVGMRYWHGVQCLYSRLNVTNMRLPMVILYTNIPVEDVRTVTANTPAAHHVSLATLFDRVGHGATTTTDHYPLNTSVAKPGRRLFRRSEHSAMYVKLWAWTLVEYKQLLVIDADIFLTTGVDSLVQIHMRHDIAATAGCTERLFNGGLMVIRPSLRTAGDLFSTRTGTKVCEMKITDQSILNKVFRNRWQPLPPWTVWHGHYEHWSPSATSNFCWPYTAIMVFAERPFSP